MTPDLLDALTGTARASTRLRSHHNLHPTLEAPIQRLAIAMEPETYVRPHRHPHTWELLIPLRGRFLFTAFDERGAVRSRHLLGGADGLAAFEFEAGTWHTVTSLEPGSIIFEVKEGPYVPVPAEDLAAWAAPEGTAQAAHFVAEQHAEALRLTGSTNRPA
jgi:cupin fold WbuC family metalloprotein